MPIGKDWIGKRVKEGTELKCPIVALRRNL